jgi:hypothetical protein
MREGTSACTTRGLRLLLLDHHMFHPNNLRLFGCSSCETFVLVFQVSQEVRNLSYSESSIEKAAEDGKKVRSFDFYVRRRNKDVKLNSYRYSQECPVISQYLAFNYQITR